MDDQILNQHIIDTLGNKLIKQKPLVDKIEIIDYDPTDVAPPFKSSMWRGYPVYYDDIQHLYFTIQKGHRIPLLSTTTIWGLFEQEFDTKARSLSCAQKLEYDCKFLNKKGWEALDVEKRASRIARAWKKNNKDATDYGSAAHETLESLAKNLEVSIDEVLIQIKYQYGKTATRPVIRTFAENMFPMIHQFVSDGYVLDAEPVISALPFGLAGQADLGLVHHGRKVIKIRDYKTNKVKPGEEQQYNNMLAPFDAYPDIAFIHYCLQLATYAIMMMYKYPGYAVEDMVLLWLNPENGDIEPVEVPLYWINTVRGHLNTFKAAGVIDAAYDKMKRKFKIAV